MYRRCNTRPLEKILNKVALYPTVALQYRYACSPLWIRAPSRRTVSGILYLVRSAPVQDKAYPSSGVNMSQPNLNHKVPPFVTTSTLPARDDSGYTVVSQITMVVSLVALIASMIGGTKLILDVFDDGLGSQIDGLLFARVVALGLAFFFGWIMALISTRAFSNLLLPFLVNVLAWLCLAGIGILDVRIIMKLYQQAYAPERFFAFVLMMFGGIFALAGLHLIVEGHDLRPYSVPLLIITAGHLVAIVYRYVFTDAKPAFLAGDLIFFFIMAVSAGLMLAHFGVLTPMRQMIELLFKKDGESFGQDW
jgi:hypothetical protein